MPFGGSAPPNQVNPERPIHCFIFAPSASFTSWFFKSPENGVPLNFPSRYVLREGLLVAEDADGWAERFHTEGDRTWKHFREGSS